MRAPARIAALIALGACTSPGDSKPGDTGSGALTPARAEVTPHACASPGPPGFSPVAWPGLYDASAANTPIQYGGGGAAAFDSDGDGRYELYTPNAGPDQFWTFDPDLGPVDVSGQIPGGETDATVGAVPADVDGDGDLDLFVLNMRGPDRLLRNDLDLGGAFSDVTAEAGVGGGAWDSVGASFADIDLDGDLDLFVARHRDEADLTEGMISGTMPPGHPSGLYLNRGDGTFEDASDRLPAALQDNGYPFAGLFHDFDRDGLPDLYVILDFGPMSSPNLLLLNDPGDPGALAPAGDAQDLGVEMYAMGVAPTDPDADGRPDLAISDWGRILLLASDGEGGRYDASQAAGLLPLAEGRMQAWGVEFADADNDGDEDLFAAFSPLVMPPEIEELLGEELALSNPPDQPDALYLRDDGAGTFTEAAAARGIDQRTLSRGFVLVDLDGDGWLDLLKRALDAPAALYRSACGTSRALVISLRQPGMNTHAIGAEVIVRAGGRVQWRGVRAGGTGFATGMPPEIHVGIGAATEAEIEVRWPDGARSVVTAAAGDVLISREAP